jgi:ferrous iron transport protein A
MHRVKWKNKKIMEKQTKLSSFPAGATCRLVALECDKRMTMRLVGMGLIPGCKVEVLQNMGRQALLVYARDSVIAVARKESEKIIGEEL